MAGFWHSVTRFDRSRINTWIALRNSLAVAIPLALGVAFSRPAGGLIAAIGALNVAYSDGTDSYFTRARRMAAATLLVAAAVPIGGVTAGNVGYSVLLTAACAFAAGMMAAVGQTAADIANITLVTLIVFSAHRMSPEQAWQSGALTLAGGLLQTIFALALWPVRGHAPERRALAAFYQALALGAAVHAPAVEAPPASVESTQAQKALASAGGRPPVEVERYLALLSQAERIRLALLALSRVGVRLVREGGAAAAPPDLERCRELASRLLATVARALRAGEAAAGHFESLNEFSEAALRLRESAATAPSGDVRALMQDAGWQLEALAGQLRSALELAGHISPAGAAAFARLESARPRELRLMGAWPVLRANLSLHSAACRHAVRLAVSVAAGEAIAHAVDWQRSYWLPMTVAIVLRPDFSGTFSRGVLRLAGTLAGLACATVLFHLLAPPAAAQVALLFAATFGMRWLGPANYGIFCTALSAMIVLLIALTGVPPAQVIAARGVNTFAGGVLALVAYALWPTWERTQVGEVLAGMLDSYRRYLEAVANAYLHPDQPAAGLDGARLAARLARSNLEASAARLHGEPGVGASRLASLNLILANSHRFIHAVMSLEAGLARSRPAPARPGFRSFARDAARTLELLARGLRAGESAQGLPDLREDHRGLLRFGAPHVERYEMVNLETDRITNSLNTLAEEIGRWIGK